MFGFSILGPKTPQGSLQFLQQLEKTTKKNENFFKLVEKWHHLEISYGSKWTQLKNEMTISYENDHCLATAELAAFLSILIDNHKNYINKIHQDVFLANSEICSRSLAEQKNIIQTQKILHKQLLINKNAVQKLRVKRMKIKRQLQDEQTMEILGKNSYEQSIDRKMKRFNKMKQITKQKDDFEEKVREYGNLFGNIINKSNQNIHRFNQLTQQLLQDKYDVILKIESHFSEFARKLAAGVEKKCNSIKLEMLKENSQLPLQNKFFCSQEKQMQQKSQIKQGYLQVCFQSITEKTIDDIIQYSKDKQVKKKIKKIIQSSDVNPQNTDELTRQVQLVKKIVACKQLECLSQFKNIIVKNCKFRLNFVFILQFYRLNNQFQIVEKEIQPILLLIKELLNTCHELKDAFVLKQIMILLLTYYVSVNEPEKEEQLKIYLINFFKHSPFWKDLELWESILIECIHIQKKSTIHMLLMTSSISSRTEIVEAEKTSVMNQILYIVRTMLLYDFKPEEVKEFAYRFVKLLRQGDNFLKEVNKSIDNAVNQELKTLPSKEISAAIQKQTEKILTEMKKLLPQPQLNI